MWEYRSTFMLVQTYYMSTLDMLVKPMASIYRFLIYYVKYINITSHNVFSYTILNLNYSESTNID